MAVTFQRAASALGTALDDFDVGEPGNDRLLIVWMDDESTSGGATFDGDVTIGALTLNQGVVADDGVNVQHQELWYATESDLGVLEGLQDIAYDAGDAGWGIAAMLFYGVADQAPRSTNTNVQTNQASPSIVLTSENNDLVVVSVYHGHITASFDDWTSPLDQKLASPGDTPPSSVVFAIAEGVETTGQTDKTYSVTIGGSEARVSTIGSVWAQATVAADPDNVLLLLGVG